LCEQGGRERVEKRVFPTRTWSFGDQWQSGKPNWGPVQYETFLTIWKNADSGLAAVADARERLAQLKT